MSERQSGRRVSCCERVGVLLNWLRYAEYVIAWDGIPLTDRPRYEVVRVGDDWKAVLR